MQDSVIQIENSPSLFDFWANLKQNILIENLVIQNMSIEINCDDNVKSNVNNQCLAIPNMYEDIPFNVINLGRYLKLLL